MLNPDGSLSPVGTVANTFSSYIVSNLLPGTLYSFVVRGSDSNGNTDSNNNFVSAITYAGVTNYSVQSSTSVTLTFPSAPSARNLKIYCSTDGGTNFNLLATITSLSSSHRLTGLTSNIEYLCKVKAIAPTGSEDSNTVTVAFTLADLNFSGASQATVLNSHQVQISWTIGTGTAISNYKVYEVSSDGSSRTLNGRTQLYLYS